jgi:DNA-directed RNA polymerase specialized sigma24 family protein
VRGRVLTSDAALVEYLADHGLGRVSRRLVQTGALEVVATAIPGVREMLVLARFQHLKHEEIARLFNLSSGAVKVRLHRALRDLRDIYFRLSRGPVS